MNSLESRLEPTLHTRHELPPLDVARVDRLLPEIHPKGVSFSQGGRNSCNAMMRKGTNRGPKLTAPAFILSATSTHMKSNEIQSPLA